MLKRLRLTVFGDQKFQHPYVKDRDIQANPDTHIYTDRYTRDTDTYTDTYTQTQTHRYTLRYTQTQRCRHTQHTYTDIHVHTPTRTYTHTFLPIFILCMVLMSLSFLYVSGTLLNSNHIKWWRPGLWRIFGHFWICNLFQSLLFIHIKFSLVYKKGCLNLLFFFMRSEV